MNLRLTSVLLAVPALICGLLVVSPAEAASNNATVSTKNLAMYRSGTAMAGKVVVTCKSRATCKGTLQFRNGASHDSYRKSYSVRGRSSAYVTVLMHQSNAYNPEGKTTNGDYDYVKNVKLTINESSPSNSKPRTYTDITTETRVASQQIKGDIRALGGTAGMSDLRVELVRPVRGGNLDAVASADVSESGAGAKYSFTVALGANNSPSSVYRIRIRGVDKDGESRSWYYRGADGNSTGGGRYLRDATPVQARKTGDYDADFVYRSIRGVASSGAGSQVTVAAPPPSYSQNAIANRELDFSRCADVFGRTEAGTNGVYEIGFLPATTSQNNRYMLAYRSPGGTIDAWYGASNKAFGSCYHATGYQYSKADLITLSDGQNVDLNRGTDEVSSALMNNLTVKAAFSSAFRKKATAADKWLRIREAVPGVKILDSPVVAELQAGSSNSRLFAKLRPGKFYVEVGRRTGCSAWYASRYPDNRAYFRGGDRGSERWKTVSGRYAEYQKSKDMGYVTKTPPRGYKGWMYRGYCKAYGAGSYTTRTLSGNGQSYAVNASTSPMGAIVKGRVKRAGGKTNKEIMVRLSSSDGKRVIRTDITDGSGNFYIAGLASGKWTISVNSDSWRGIGRTFTGKHSITVKAGRGYNAGTLGFKG